MAEELVDGGGMRGAAEEDRGTKARRGGGRREAYTQGFNTLRDYTVS